MPSHRTLFKEVQHLPKAFSYSVTVILVLVLGYLYAHTYEMYLNETSIRGLSSEYKAMVGGDILITIVIIGLIYVAWSYKLVTKVSVRSFYYKHPPIKRVYQKIYTHRILSIKQTTTGDLPRGTVKIKMSGGDGVFLELEDDKKVFIGSRHPESLEKAFKRMLEQQP